MRLNWFSPLPPAATAIAEYTAMLIPFLSANADVTFWTAQHAWDPALNSRCKIREYNPADPDWLEMNNADLSIFHIGNNADFHTGIWQVSRLHAGLVVLHDVRLQDFFWGMLDRNPAGADEYIELMHRVYGPEAKEMARSIVEGRQTLAYTCVLYPLAEAVTENALATLVHTPGAFEIVAERCRCAVASIPLPYAAASWETFNEWNKRRNRPAQPPFKVVIIGYLNTNRRVDSVLEALGTLPAKNQFRLEMYGSVWDENHVRSQIKRHSLEKIVTMNGYVADLDQAIADADLAINLRFPTMGEASMSQLQLWDHALPCIVARTGWYGAQPADAVRFIDIETEVEDLRARLTEFAQDPASYLQVGEKGRSILLSKHDPSHYVEELLQLAERAVSYRPILAFAKAANVAGTDMAEWVSPGAVRRVAEKIAARVSELLPVK